jgi:hypothetical protein
VSHEEYKDMVSVSAELNAINQRLKARDDLDAERRKIDDERDKSAKSSASQLLERVDGHGGRLRTLETNWATFFSEIGAFTMVRKKLDSTDKQNRAIIALVLTTLVGVIVNLATKH